jgi:hypothetical protein
VSVFPSTPEYLFGWKRFGNYSSRKAVTEREVYDRRCEETESFFYRREIFGGHLN